MKGDYKSHLRPEGPELFDYTQDKLVEGDEGLIRIEILQLDSLRMRTGIMSHPQLNNQGVQK